MTTAAVGVDSSNQASSSAPVRGGRALARRRAAVWEVTNVIVDRSSAVARLLVDGLTEIAG